VSFFNRLVWIFVSPSRVFSDISEGRAPWWQPWVWQSILYVIAGLISLPIQRTVAELNLNDLPADQLQKQLELMDRFGWVQMAGTPFLLLLLGLLLAGVTYVLVTILSPQANFRKYFTLTLYVSIIGALSLIVGNVAVRMRGLDAIRTIEDSQITLGLGFLAPEGNTLVYGILSTINVFSIWSFVVLGMGLMAIFGMSRGNAIACVLPWWVIAVIFTVMGAAFSGMG
jgi:hypothetical protein